MKIATFNANSIRVRLPIVLRWLRENEPDLLCLQETKVPDPEFPVQPFAEAGYHVAYRGGKAYAGVAVAARVPLRQVRFGLDDGEEPDENRLAWVRIGSVNVVNTYVPQGRDIEHPMYRYKLRWFQRLRGFFERHFTPRARVVWTGDLNIAPEPMDVHNPERQTQHVCYHADARTAFNRVREWGFVDVFRQHHPEPGQYTFFDYRFPSAVKQRRGWRVDHILATRPMARRCTACEIDLQPRLAPAPSDHTFVTAEFDV